MFAILGKLSGVHSFITRELLQARSIQLDREDMPLPGIVLVGGEKNSARRFVHSFDSEHLEIALRELSVQLRFPAERVLLIKAVEIQVSVPVAPARPQKTVPRLQHAEVII